MLPVTSRGLARGDERQPRADVSRSSREKIQGRVMNEGSVLVHPSTERRQRRHPVHTHPGRVVAALVRALDAPEDPRRADDGVPKFRKVLDPSPDRTRHGVSFVS